MRDASRASFVSWDGRVVFVDIRRLAAEFRGEGTRGDTAERAVAPLAMDAVCVEIGRRVVVFGEREDMNSKQRKGQKPSFIFVVTLAIILSLSLSLSCPTLYQPSLFSTTSRLTRSRR